ncbi:GNAT family N-acetyltransferase [Candidatus Woesearchaeota archaeon]|nr:GNAT family N-acetyltransferase [Candidatus Woesearchaeota archaeon]
MQLKYNMKGDFVYGDLWNVDSIFRGRGIGKKLLEHAFSSVKKAGFDKLYARILLKPIHNEISVRINEQLGARCVQKIKDGKYVYGIYLAELDKLLFQEKIAINSLKKKWKS